MSTYVLVHGSFHGAWCWAPVIGLLEGAGHRVVAVDLPGHGVDRTPVAQCTLRAYVDRVRAVLDAQPEKVVLVGHSMGGMVVTQAAEEAPEKIARLIYVAAFVPKDGEALIELAQRDAESKLLPALHFEPPVHWVSAEDAREVFFHDVPEPLATQSAARLCPESLAVVEAKVHVTAARWGTLARTYVLCTQDRTLGPALQEQFAQGATVKRLDSSHSPFLSQPEPLFRSIT